MTLERLEVEVDPDENLKQQLALASHIILMAETRDQDVTADDAHELADLVVNLHEWIRKGGALPKEWQR